ncbi:MAG: PhoH family protein [Acidobacteria bacterium]|nr:MAG: PhoH family protein [Acidobacteriota bacterium]
MAGKTFVLDTNVLLHDPKSLYRFRDNEVVIPIVVIEEIDRFKKELTEVGRNARQVSRELDRLRHEGRIVEGVPTPDGGRIRIHLGVPHPAEFPFFENPDTADMRVLALAWELTRQQPPVVLVTKDTNLRIKADAMGVRAEDYEERNGEAEVERLGPEEREVAREVIDALFRDGGIAADRAGGDPGPNAPVLLRDAADPRHTAVARREPGEPLFKPVKLPRSVWGIRPRNLEQQFALDLLLDDRVPLVSLVGRAGTGKTLLALAAGLHLTVDREVYRRLVVARPIFPMGRDLGYLPGEIDEKLRPWMQPIFDNLELLLMGHGGDKDTPALDPVEHLVERGVLEIEALTYIRGRSLPRQFMIVDEAQNLTPLEVKTVITRAGEGTKVVLTGDPDQIDNPYVDARSNGLSLVAERLRGEPLAGSIFLRRGERSGLADLAAERL